MKSIKLFFETRFFLFLFLSILTTTQLLSAEKEPVILSDEEVIIQAYFDEAIVFYNNSDWANAKCSFYKYLQLLNLNDFQISEGLFYYAKSSFNEGDYFVAIKAYNEYLLNAADKEKRDIAHWDRVMIAFDVDKELAVRYLTSLAYDNGYRYMQEAKELLIMMR